MEREGSVEPTPLFLPAHLEVVVFSPHNDSRGGVHHTDDKVGERKDEHQHRGYGHADVAARHLRRGRGREKGVRGTKRD